MNFEVANQEGLTIALFFSVPGIIILFGRSQFLTGGFKSSSDHIISYFVVSAAYLAISIPLIRQLNVSLDDSFLIWFIFVFAVPLLVGAVLGLAVRNRWLVRAFRFLKINPVNAIPTAWDWKLGSVDASYVIATLKNGTRYYGYLGANSFVSSDPSERDIYIEKCYEIKPDNTWESFPNSGVLITSGEIMTIEFFSVSGVESHER